MELARQIGALREAHIAACNAQPCAAETGFFILAASDLHGDELSTLRALARVRLNADGRPLAHHVQELVEEHDRALEDRQAVSTASLPADMGAEIVPRSLPGEFAQTSGEFRFDVSALVRPARPWINVLANPGFGAQISEAGGGYSWALNSRLNMLTPWSNDPVADPPGEWFLLQDTRTMQAWSVAPSAAGDKDAEYRVSHGQGSQHHQPSQRLARRQRFLVRRHRRRREAGAAAPHQPRPQDDQPAPRRHRRMDPRRQPGRPRHHRDQRRQPARRAGRGQRHGARGDEPAGDERRMTTLFCTQRDRAGGFGGGTAFFGLAGDAEDLTDWTCDRRESFDARGRLVIPDQYGQASGGGLDPCAAIATRITLRAGDTIERTFLLGWAASPDGAQALAASAALVAPLQRRQAVREHWDALLEATEVKTPDPLFDAMVNRWLLYQTVACRLWAKAGFYQAGGAYGYRDQLQDAMALAWAAPDMLRRQIVLAASRQFPEGDVQHWWHAPTGAGVRTHFSDDLLWLPHAALRYTAATGDAGVLDESVPFLEGMAVPAGAEDAYYVPGIGAETRERLRALRPGDRPQPDDRRARPAADGHGRLERRHEPGRPRGPRRVGLARLVPGRRRRAASRRSPRRAASARAPRAGATPRAAGGARSRTPAGTAQWYRRAFFDDGTPLGSARQRGVPHRPDRPGLGGALRGRARGAPAPGDGRARARSWSIARPASSACSTRRSRFAAAERRLHPGLSARACARTAASIRMPASGR